MIKKSNCYRLDYVVYNYQDTIHTTQFYILMLQLVKIVQEKLYLLEHCGLLLISRGRAASSFSEKLRPGSIINVPNYFFCCNQQCREMLCSGLRSAGNLKDYETFNFVFEVDRLQASVVVDNYL